MATSGGSGRRRVSGRRPSALGGLGCWLRRTTWVVDAGSAGLRPGVLLALRFLALALHARLLVMLASASLGEDAGLLDLLVEAAQGAFERLVLTHSDFCQSRFTSSGSCLVCILAGRSRRRHGSPAITRWQGRRSIAEPPGAVNRLGAPTESPPMMRIRDENPGRGASLQRRAAVPGRRSIHGGP